MKRHRRDLEIMSEMNLTNLLDTAFTLLIAFMLITPMVKHGLELDLPSVSNDQPIEAESEIVTIVIQKPPLEGLGEPIYLDEKRMDPAELRDELIARRRADENVSVVVEADRESRHQTFALVLNAVQQAGIQAISVATESTELTSLEPDED